ncbi:MAG: MFS transporter, partial [Lachnospiraceae bacterium]|nr:MFS transporter [Lachnospiraceae bacterium]
MKLNYGRTVRIGFAFLAICAFWQMYNNVIPLILTNTFHMNESLSGAIMAADNVLALFLLPLFGSLSDKCKSPMGRRKPFILAGTVLSVLLMLLVPVLDNRYFSHPSQELSVVFVCVLGLLLIAMGTYRSPAVALMPDLTPKPFRSRANAVINLMGALGGIIYLILASILYSEARTKGLAHVNYLPLFLIVAAIMALSLLIVLFTI